MHTGTILAHKHTLVETYAGFFRALSTESFASVRQWLHPELERLIAMQCHKIGENKFLRSLRHGLGSATQRLRLGGSQADGAGQIRTELLTPRGERAGHVRFVLSGDGWRIYAIEVYTNSSSRPSSAATGRGSPLPSATAQKLADTQVYQQQPQTGRSSSKPGAPRALSSRWLAKVYASD